MPHLGHFAVHRRGAAHHARAERLAERLVPEADAEERDIFIEADQLENAARAIGRAGTRRDHDRARLLREQLRGIEAIITDYLQPRAGEALDLLNQVVGEGVVVVDDDERARAKETRRRSCGSARSPEGGRSWSAENSTFFRR